MIENWRKAPLSPEKDSSYDVTLEFLWGVSANSDTFTSGFSKSFSILALLVNSSSASMFVKISSSGDLLESPKDSFSSLLAEKVGVCSGVSSLN